MGMYPRLPCMRASLFALVFAALANAALVQHPTCVAISKAISSASAVFYPGDPTYIKDISHWATSSTQESLCTVEPGTAEDVGAVLKVIGQTRTPWNVKGGGHASNPGFSSTPGVLIAMYRFNEVSYDSASSTATISTGIVWDAVYAALDQYKVNIVGGRVSGVGVAGFTLGGGYSWLTSQRGLTIDSITNFELVLPNGTVTQVSNSSNPDLFFGLKGGFNNFGIVTRFTMNAFPQGQVWGGLRIYTPPFLDQVTAATLDFSQNVKDPKASIITTYNTAAGIPTVIELMFYDAPTPPAGIFDGFLAVPATISTVGTKSFSDFVSGTPANISGLSRTAFHTVSLKSYSASLLKTIQDQSAEIGAQLTLAGDVLISYDVEPFVVNLFDNSKGGAYPHDRANPLLPLNLYYAWTPLVTGPSFPNDQIFIDAIKNSTKTIFDQAIAEGQDISGSKQILYPNYALPDTPLEMMYGSNLPRLKAIKQQYDPQNVTGLTGGFKF